MPSPPPLLKYIQIFCSVSTFVRTSDQMSKIGIFHLILKHLISLVFSLAQLVSPSVALPAELVSTLLALT